MPDYWVFQDKLFKRACIHRSNCSVRKGAISPGCLEGTWHGAYTTYEEARRTAAEMSAKKGALCPGHRPAGPPRACLDQRNTAPDGRMDRAANYRDLPLE